MTVPRWAQLGWYVESSYEAESRRFGAIRDIELLMIMCRKCCAINAAARSDYEHARCTIELVEDTARPLATNAPLDSQAPWNSCRKA